METLIYTLATIAAIVVLFRIIDGTNPFGERKCSCRCECKEPKEYQTRQTPKREPTHPGIFLERDYMQKLGLSKEDLAKAISEEVSTIEAILNKQAPITPYIADKLAAYFGTTGQFWLNTQNNWDNWRNQ